MDGLPVFVFFEVGIASLCVSSGKLLIVFQVFSPHFNGLLTKLPALTVVALFEVHSCRVGHVSQVGGVQVLGPVLVLQGCVKSFFLYASFPSSFSFRACFLFSGRSSSIGSGLVSFLGGGGGGAATSSSSILPRSNPRRTLRVVMMRGSCSFVPRSDGLFRSCSIRAP